MFGASGVLSLAAVGYVVFVVKESVEVKEGADRQILLRVDEKQQTGEEESSNTSMKSYGGVDSSKVEDVESSEEDVGDDDESAGCSCSLSSCPRPVDLIAGFK